MVYNVNMTPNNKPKPNWKNVVVKLGSLKPWEQNPKTISKAAAKRLLESFDDFGQVQTVAIGPDGEVYDGHQRLSALLTVYGPAYELDARQSDRPLSDDERRRLVVTLHSGAVGEWDWDALSGWDADELQGWGFDQGTLAAWNNDTANLREMLGSTVADEPKEYDETIADGISICICAECGHEHSAKKS